MTSVLQSSVATSAITHVETEHARLRRKQRGIDKKDLQAAKKHGKRCVFPLYRSPKGNMIYQYNYEGIIYKVDSKTGEEITAYANPLPLKKIKNAHGADLPDPRKWTSNTVFVVDTSGSMKESDMWGTRNRLDSVWVCLALDFIAYRLESGTACSTDVISVVLMGDSSSILIQEMPTTWELYNQIVDIYSNPARRIPPRSHGNYVPALRAAEELLRTNTSPSCAAALFFLSDGKPSDTGNKTQLIEESVRSLAEKFGRRLTFTAVGIGDLENFDTLNDMVEVAWDYGVQAEFRLPSFTSSSLGEVFTSSAQSLTTTQTEMTDLGSLKQHRIRDVARESRTKANQEIAHVNLDEFWLYPIAKVRRLHYQEWFVDRQKYYRWEDADLESIHTKYVAMNKKAFGEGAERFAYRFYEVAEDRKTILGQPMVAKESRLVLEGGEKERDKFVRTFVQTQQLARRLAEEFNKKLDRLHRVSNDTPRIVFLDCSVYELHDKILGKQSVLVEEKLDHNSWHKWNANNGYVEGMTKAPSFSFEAMKSAMDHLAKLDNLGIIEEDEDEEDSDDDSEQPSGIASKIAPRKFSPGEVAQAFSHFSYWASGRKRLVCDLQGVYDKEQNLLKFSDPVIHYHNHRREDRKGVHGRTDRGRKGMALFFDTHQEQCGYLCRLVNGGFHRPNTSNRVHSHRQGSSSR